MNILSKIRAFRGGFHGGKTAGFTLVEFMIATFIFLVVGGSVFAMFASHAPYFNRQQNLAAVNIALQNTVAQLQLDLANAGSGYYPGSLIASWPVGVTITNQVPGGPACNVAATFTYTALCFDTLNILTVNTNVPPAHPTDATGSTAGTTCSQIDSSPFYIQPNPGQTPAQTAAGFSANDQVLLVTTGAGTHGTKGPSGGNSSTASSGTLVNTFVLSGAPIVGANYVALPFNAISVANYNAGTFYTDDPLHISDSTTGSTNLGGAFCTADWLMKLAPTKYHVDVSVPSDPKLVRTQNGNDDIIAEQIIGFKVGAATWNSTQSLSSPTYSFYAPNALNANPPGYGNNFQLIRSVRVTLIGRTNPNPDPTYTFRNTFDGGPYQVTDAIVVINPRNMTMNAN